jgi:hypothetical protein
MISKLLKLFGLDFFSTPRVRAYYLSFKEVEALMKPRKVQAKNEFRIKTDDRLSFSSGLFDRTVLGLP